MAGSTRAELALNGLDASSFGSGYPTGRSGSFRESVMVSGGGVLRNGSGAAAVDAAVPAASQYLVMESFPTAGLKNGRSGELRRVLGISLEDHSFVSSQSKPLPPVSWEELKRFKESVEESCSRARDKDKTLQECIQKLDKYRNIVTKKRQRSEVQLSEKTGGSGLLKIGSQMHQNLSDLAGQKLDERAKNGLPNKRVRSSMAEVRASSPYPLPSEGRNTPPVRQNTMVDKDKIMLRACNTVPLSNEDNIYSLTAGGDGWEKKMKRKRSVGSMANRTTDGDRELKQATQQRPNTEPRPRTADALGFRIGSSNGITGCNKIDGSFQLGGCNSRISPRNDLSNGPLPNDRKEKSSGLAKERVTSKGSNKLNICEDAQLGSQSPLMKRKASRSPRTGSSAAANAPNFPHSSGGIDGWEQTSGLNKVQPMAGAINNKCPLPTASSSPPVTKWGGQRSQKFSRTRRTNVISPVSNFDEAQNLSEGVVAAADLGARPSTTEASGILLNQGLQNNTHLKLKIECLLSPTGLSETEEAGCPENKCKEKGSHSGVLDDRFLNASHKAATFVLPTKKNKIPPRDEIGDGVRRQGRSGRGSVQSKACLQLSKEKLENVESNKPPKSGRLTSDKTERIPRPSKKVSDRKGCTRPMQIINNVASELHGESDDDRDDREELLAVAKDTRDVSRFGKFWQVMEPIFGSLTSDDFSFVKHQISFAEEVDECFTNMLGSGDHVGETESGFEKVIPISERLVSAFISEEETDVLDKNIKQGDIPLSLTSDRSPFGTNSYVTNYGLELENDMGKMNFYPSTPCNGFASPNSFQCSSNFISGEELMHGNFELGFPDNLDTGASNQGGSTGTSETDTSPYECQYEQMSFDDKVLMELQSISIYPEVVPDVAKRDGSDIDRTISELKIRLYQQVPEKKGKLCQLEKAIQEQKDYDKRNLERIAMEKLVVKAQKQLLGGRSHGSSHRSGASKIAKQQGMAFAKRTLARYRKFLQAGENCFSEPFLRDVLFSEPLRECDPEHADGNSRIPHNKNGENCRPGPWVSASGAQSNMVEKYGQDHKIERSELDLYHGAAHLSDQTFVKNDPVSNRGKKREVLLDDVAISTLPGVAKWKKTDKDHNRNTLTKNTTPKGGRSSLNTGRGERKTKSKPKQKIAQLSTSGSGLGRVIETTNFVSSSIRDSSDTYNTASTRTNQEIELPSTRNNSKNLPKEAEDTMFTNLPLHGLDSIDQLIVGQGQDIGSWLNVDEDALLDIDLVGLEIPMDDLSDLKFI